MSSIITSILSSTVGLLWNKARDSTAAKLKDGDVTDSQIRQIVVRELNDIKTKLDGLSRTNLLSSYSFLEEGVGLLSVFLDKSNENVALLNEAKDGGETSRLPSDVESDILNEAMQLSSAMAKLKINSDKELESAKERFKDARKRATDAFCNEALSIKDRILAAKLRVISEILECLETPETAITGCLLFLKKLHCLPVIREMFLVYLNGGGKSLLSKAERAENVKSVMFINYVLFQFVWKFSSKYCSPHTWPKIELFDRSFNPIFNWREMSTRKSMPMGDELIQAPHELLLDERINQSVSAVNSHREIVVGFRADIKVISTTGESKVVKLPHLKERKVIYQQHIAGVAVDNNNGVNVVKWVKTRGKDRNYVLSFVLFVLDENYNAKHECILEFFESIGIYVWMAITINNDIIMTQVVDPNVYVCDKTGQLKHKFKLDLDTNWSSGLSISNKNEIVIQLGELNTVQIYTEEGEMKSSIKTPEGHVAVSVAFHHVLSKLIILSYCTEQDSYSYFLHFYSEPDELETSTFLCKTESVDGFMPNIISHPSGPVAVVTENDITFI